MLVHNSYVPLTHCGSVVDCSAQHAMIVQTRLELTLHTDTLLVTSHHNTHLCSTVTDTHCSNADKGPSQRRDFESRH